MKIIIPLIVLSTSLFAQFTQKDYELIKTTFTREFDPDIISSHLASDNEKSIILDMNRDDALKGEGLMRDLARRVQSLRKDLGFAPTDIVNVVHVADLDPEDIKILSPFIDEMEELVRAKKVNVHQKKIDINADWNETKLDKKKVHVAVI